MVAAVDRDQPRFAPWYASPKASGSSLIAGTLVEDTTSTFAEGLATRTAFELPQQILRDLLAGLWSGEPG